MWDDYPSAAQVPQTEAVVACVRILVPGARPGRQLIVDFSADGGTSCWRAWNGARPSAAPQGLRALAGAVTSRAPSMDLGPQERGAVLAAVRGFFQRLLDQRAIVRAEPRKQEDSALMKYRDQLRWVPLPSAGAAPWRLAAARRNLRGFS
ncbi:hypothetical protein N9L68_03215 [bacterium]|nr:hypothetical protein [bacterium]